MTTPAPTDQLRSTAFAADYLATSTTTIRRMFHDGELEGVRHRGTLKFRQSVLDDYIERHTVSNEPRARAPRATPERASADIERRYPFLQSKRGVA